MDVEVIDLRIRCPQELWELIQCIAAMKNEGIAEHALKVIAESFMRPDLGEIPKKRPGRPRKNSVLATSTTTKQRRKMKEGGSP